MNNRIKIILIGVLVLAIVLLIVFWVLSSRSSERDVLLPEVVIDNRDSVDSEPETKPKSEVFVPRISEEEKLKAQLERMSMSFVERYGSYSNQSDYENLEDLLPFMTSKFRRWTEDFINDKRFNDVGSAIYYGITTKALRSELEDFLPDAGRVKFNISTQRQEIYGSSANANVYYQDVSLELAKEEGAWKVTRATWK